MQQSLPCPCKPRQLQPANIIMPTDKAFCAGACPSTLVCQAELMGACGARGCWQAGTWACAWQSRPGKASPRR